MKASVSVSRVGRFPKGSGKRALTVIYLLIVYGIIITVDANVLVPILFSEAVDLHPVTIIVAILLFGAWWGFWGVFFAIPLAAFIKTVLRCWPRTLSAT